MSAALTYRLYKPADFEAIFRLWDEFSGWGGISEQQFKQWYLETPNGCSIIVVAVNNDNRVVGQTVFIPSKLYAHGRYMNSYRISAPILDNTVRQKDLKFTFAHPAFAMFNYGLTVAKEKGFEVVYFFPAYAWTGVLKHVSSIVQTTYACFAISLNKPETFIDDPKKVSVKTASAFNEEYDQLWKDCISNFPINYSVIRDAKQLAWKLADEVVFEIRQVETQQLKGYIAVKKKTGLIVDMLARTKEDLKENFAVFIRAIHDLNPQKILVEWKEIKGMQSPLFQFVLQNIKFNLPKYNFAFGYISLNGTDHEDLNHPDNWYLMPSD
ncbi:hypothetical protein [uncultured Mucilaginibacter sp.]|uniref:hypothetical protein n=1 Tax=uncultured Mucilaginibacter sp. TaxID=797541 RepID=UPI00261A0225|nr:hypothetical protein [uncultured Mucilaginibacter sp.]